MNPGIVRRALAIGQKDGLRAVMKAAARRIVDEPPDPELREPLSDVFRWLARQRSVSVVQVGAYVGDSRNDPLHRFLLSASPALNVVLVEPVTAHFEQLQTNYAVVPGVSFENVAVADTPGFREFYRLGVDPVAHGMPEWLAQLGSLRPERMTEMWARYERDPELQRFWQAHRVVDTVRCETLEAILERYRITDLDLLQIDAEGSDYDILRTIDFERIRPRFINYERVLLGPDEEPCREMLCDAGYVTVDWGQDTLAVAVQQTSSP